MAIEANLEGLLPLNHTANVLGDTGFDPNTTTTRFRHWKVTQGPVCLVLRDYLGISAEDDNNPFLKIFPLSENTLTEITQHHDGQLQYSPIAYPPLQALRYIIIDGRAGIHTDRNIDMTNINLTQDDIDAIENAPEGGTVRIIQV